MMKKLLAVFVFISIFSAENIFAAKVYNNADAFMSLPFGHSYSRTQKRMENSGAITVTPRKDSLTMSGMVEGYPATFIFGFHKNKILKTKSVYLQSMGNKEYDKQFYEGLLKAYNTRYGTVKESPSANMRKLGKIILRNVWTPDRYTTITLTYNPEASKRFPGSSLSEIFIQLIYKYDKWD